MRATTAPAMRTSARSTRWRTVFTAHPLRRHLARRGTPAGRARATAPRSPPSGGADRPGSIASPASMRARVAASRSAGSSSSSSTSRRPAGVASTSSVRSRHSRRPSAITRPVREVEVKRDGLAALAQPVVDVVEAVGPEMPEGHRARRQVDAMHVHRRRRDEQHDRLPPVALDQPAVEALLLAVERALELEDLRQRRGRVSHGARAVCTASRETGLTGPRAGSHRAIRQRNLTVGAA